MSVGLDKDASESRTRLWKAFLCVLGVLAANGLWLLVLGSAVVWFRLHSIGVPALPAITQLPFDARVTSGAGYVALSVLFALLCWAILGVAYNWAPDAERTNRHGVVPFQFELLLIPAFIVLLVASIQTTMRGTGPYLFVALPTLLAAVTWLLVRAIEGFVQAGLIVLAGALLAGGTMGLVYEATRSPRLDVVAVVDARNAAVGGYYVSDSNDEVALVVPRTPGGIATRVYANSSNGTAPIPNNRCDNLSKSASSAIARARQCYLNVLLFVPRHDVRRLAIGPARVPVNPTGYRAARRLAEDALRIS